LFDINAPIAAIWIFRGKRTCRRFRKGAADHSNHDGSVQLGVGELFEKWPHRQWEILIREKDPGKDVIDENVLSESFLFGFPEDLS
jgi:hypothetical protein